MVRVLSIALVVALATATARASPFWVSWDEGWPDQQGWLEGWSIPAEKWLEDGLLFMDSRAGGGYDGYYQHPETLMPAAGETFRLVWRARVDESWPASDPGLIVIADDHYSVDFFMDTQGIYSGYEPDKWAPFAPGVFHDFRVESTDMRAYDLYIDGSLALEGSFSYSFFPGPQVAWGDLSSAFSLTAWDTVGYGVLPEPAASLSIVLVFCCARSLSRSTSRRLHRNTESGDKA
jgi:hypothetical protein